MPEKTAVLFVSCADNGLGRASERPDDHINDTARVRTGRNRRGAQLIVLRTVDLADVEDP